MTGQPDFKSIAQRIQEAKDKAYRRGFWMGIVACLVGRAIIDIFRSMGS